MTAVERKAIILQRVNSAGSISIKELAQVLSVPGITSKNSIKSGAVGHSECDLTIAGTG